MRRNADFFQIAMGAAPTAMIAVDGAGGVVLVNRAAELLFGYTRTELTGRPVEMLVPKRFRRGHEGFRTDFLQEPRRRPVGAGRDLFGRRKDGSEVAVEIALNPFRTDEGAFVLASIIDITERKRAEEELRRTLGEKEVLLKEVHHRVKNNLQFISSLLSLQAAANGGEIGALLLVSQNRIQSMAMIHEMLYRSQSLARIDMAEYVQSLVEMLRNTYMDLPARIEVDLRIEEARMSVDAAVPVGLIINELVSNSMKHAFNGAEEGAITILMEESDEGGVRMRVADNGSGLATGASSEEGLGLRLVRLLTQQLRGTLDVEGGPSGAAFVLCVPPEGVDPWSR